MRLASGLVFAVMLLCTGAVSAEMVLNRSGGSDPSSLDPQRATGNTAVPILNELFVGLVTTDENGKLTYGLAASHTVSDDGLFWEYTLRDELKWSDGVPLTAEDFVWSLRRLMLPETASRYAQFFYSVKNGRPVNGGDMPPERFGVSAPDSKTIRFELINQDPLFAQSLNSFAAMPSPRHKIDELGTDWTKPGQFVTNGAYTLEEWVPGTRLTLKKNPNFYDAANVKIDTVNFFPTQNLNTVFNRFRAGELDVILNFPPDQMDWIKENLADELRIAPTLGVYYFLINTKKPPFDDIRVRKALALAFDKETMIDRLLNTGVVPAYSFVSPVVDDYTVANASIAHMPIADRLVEAKALMEDAGYTRDNPLTFELAYDTLEENRKIAVAMKSMWGAIGVNAELMDTEFRNLNRKARTRDYDIMRWAWFSPFNDAAGYLNLMRSNDPSNYIGFANAEFDAIMNAVGTISDTAKRNKLMHKAEQILMEDYAMIPIYHYVSRRLVKTYIGGWVGNARNAYKARYLTVNRPKG
ncbi:MAG: peptide ABC transporter substrate-binding protein [Rhodospirillaceae bacterium]|jgi:oligopeptide transport system substrate-binding protein|nr:peptide ABC transporter substrate-binding protein [Rhodospirillaceae bacterium]